MKVLMRKENAVLRQSGNHNTNSCCGRNLTLVNSFVKSSLPDTYFRLLLHQARGKLQKLFVGEV